MIRDLHGLKIEFSGPPAIMEAIAERLQYIPEDAAGPADLRFEYVMAATPSQHLALRPRGAGRPFYDPSSGEATYWPDGDACYIELDDRARALCRASEGRCIVSLLGPVADALWVASHPLLTLPLLEMLKRREIFFVHAAALARNGRCVLLPGTSGSGKSTLSAALLRSGAAYMSDDVTLLNGGEEIRALAFPEPVSLSRSAADFFPDISNRLTAPLAAGFPKHEVELSLLSCNPSCRAAICWDAKPVALIFPTVSLEDKSVMQAISGDEALSLLAANLMLTQQRSTQAHLDALAALAREVPSMRLHTGRDLDRVCEMCREFLA